MHVSKILGIILILLSILFLGLQSQVLEIEASGVKSLAMILLTLLYILKVKKKHMLFLLFLIFFTVAEIFNYVTWVRDFEMDEGTDYLYYVGNALYILSYTFLIARIFVGTNMIKAISKFPMQTLLLVVLGVFVVYLVTDTTKSELDNSQYTLEFSYNAVIVFLMCSALVNYMFKDNKKSMNLLIGSICIVFSEILQLAYFYIADSNILNLLCSMFLVAAFVFFYLQSRLENEVTMSYAQQHNLKV
ncbi:hypothetical protein [uncultured Psychroserpens sp.]|uniref:hypothetical protein n=1 Tax=uncultured Psychroserpens sp. TaxID=255436 RepID=UPI002618EBE2|nr:hypothetical protein [uncultured Psychroserpens sp.]